MKRLILLTSCTVFVLVALPLASESQRETERARYQTAAGQFLGASPIGGGEDLDEWDRPSETRTLVVEWTFDAGAICDAQGWTSHDMTEQTGYYWHVDDFAGVGPGDFGLLAPLEGLQSLWCGARPGSSDRDICWYATLPGYGNDWDQSWTSVCFETDPLLPISVDYLVAWDTETDYDFAYVEYVARDSCADLADYDELVTWNEIGEYTGRGTKTLASGVIPAPHGEAVRIRFRFVSNGNWSDADGSWNTDGAIHIDSLVITDGVTTYDYEDFEDENGSVAPRDIASKDGDWQCRVPLGFGDFAGQFPGVSILQEDKCVSNITCFWSFIEGSTYNYWWRGYPNQAVVPGGNHRGQFIDNEIWSPVIPWSAAGTGAELEFDVYTDLDRFNCVFYTWAVRSWESGCPGPWRDRSPGYDGLPNWEPETVSIGGLIPSAADSIQISLGVVDMRGLFGFCDDGDVIHSHAPLFDNVRLYEVNSSGAWWRPDRGGTFNDNFPRNGTSEGTGRIDAGFDKAGEGTLGIVPGDSSTISVIDPDFGLREPDPLSGSGAAVYLYARVNPARELTSDAQADSDRWPLLGSLFCEGRTWYIFRCDSVFTEVSGPRTGAVPDRFCVDLNDNYFTNGDTLLFFFAAENAMGQWSYWGEDIGAVDATEPLCDSPMEMQILPSNYGGDILFVNNFHGGGGEPYFESAFQMLGIEDQVDRFDKRDPASCLGNGLGGRVSDVFAQVIANYTTIIWFSGSLDAGTVGDGTGAPEKEDDFALLTTFLSQHTADAGVYFTGDNMAEEWAALGGGSADAFTDAYIPYSLSTGDHSVGHGATPLVVGEAGGLFDPHWGAPVTYVSGACPEFHDFDQIEPTGISVLEMTYGGTHIASDGAVISASRTNDFGHSVGVVLSGFGYQQIRDDEATGIPDRVEYLNAILQWLGNVVSGPTGTGDVPIFVNELVQNYPNPLNPTTTIEYSIKERARVTLKVYDVTGRLVRTLVDDVIDPAQVTPVTWDGRNDADQEVSSGVYFYKLVTRDFSQTKKMVLLK